MSKKRFGLLITPPLFPNEHPIEKEEFNGIPCSYCHGNGWIIGANERRETERTECPVCKGYKRLKAEVTICWKPDK